MAESTITTQIKIDGRKNLEFASDWEIAFKGSKYIMPLRLPQLAKENTSLRQTLDLTFQHWAEYQLKRWYFFTVQPVDSSTAIADKYIASVSLDLRDFKTLLSQVLQHYYGDKITVDLNTAAIAGSEAVSVTIDHSYIWDVLAKLYELYAVRWRIEPRADNDNHKKDGERYVIKIGYDDGSDLTQVFKYGFDGGLMKIERQVQDENIRNMIIGRGGTTNMRDRYFKAYDSDNPSFLYDPDWVPELKDIYFDSLRGATFRSYIQGWKAGHYPTGIITTPSADKAYAPWAWMRGRYDATFNPIEYVADGYDTADGKGYNVVPGSSIDRYGPLMGGLENNEEIYPTIRGVLMGKHRTFFSNDYGRVDQVVAVEKITSDDVAASAESDAKIKPLVECRGTLPSMAASSTDTITIPGKVEGGDIWFVVPEGRTANLEVTIKVIRALSQSSGATRPGYSRPHKGYDEEDVGAAQILSYTIKAFNYNAPNVALGPVALPAGVYRYVAYVTVKNTLDKVLKVTVGDEAPKLKYSTLDAAWNATWDIWVKNIWGTQLGVAQDGTAISGETPDQYVARVWGPILGNKDSNEAKVLFTSGSLATSSDYEFTIVNNGIHYDTTRKLRVKDTNGIWVDAPSHWRITLAKSDAELDATGVYLPSTRRNAAAGDYFYFTGIDIPHEYVVWSEEILDDYKKDALAKVSDIKPTIVVGLDKERMSQADSAGVKLMDKLVPGGSFRIFDKRFFAGGNETLYIQSITYRYNEGDANQMKHLPEVEVVLGNDFTPVTSPVATINSDIDALRRQLGSIANVERVVRALCDKIYLHKDGVEDTSLSPTSFVSRLSSDDFRPGIVGGVGWGIGRDTDGNTVFEVDKLNVRQDMLVNNLVINQIVARGGMEIHSAASLEITEVVKDDAGNYVCYFDQKSGTIANLFKLNDIAYCSRFLPDNKALKSYKREVIAVAINSVTLSSGGILLQGIPEQGDVIVQFGNTKDTARQFVKVTDVIGGGYEMFLQGLNAVTARGKIYWLAGRKDGSTPQVFIGDENGEYMRWQDGKLNINGTLSVTSTVGNQTFVDWTSQITEAQKAAQRIDQWASDGYFSPTEKQGLKDELARVEAESKRIRKGYEMYNMQMHMLYSLAVVDYTKMLTDCSASTPENIPVPSDFDIVQNNYYTQLTDAINKLSEGMVVGGENLALDTSVPKDTSKSEKFTFKPQNTNVLFDLYRVPGLRKGDAIVVSFDYVCSGLAISDSSLAYIQGNTALKYLRFIDKLPLSGSGHIEYKLTVNKDLVGTEENCKAQLRLDYVGAQSGGYIKISNFMVQRGNKATAWQPSPSDTNAIITQYDYLRAALKESITLKGGLMLGTMVSLGYHNTDYTTQEVYSGLNGAYDSRAVGNGIAAWFGGECEDLATYYAWDDNSGTWKLKVADSIVANKRIAKGVDRMDGSGYRAGGQLWWDAQGNAVFSGTLRSRGAFGGLLKKEKLILTDENYEQYIYNVTDNYGTYWKLKIEAYSYIVINIKNFCPARAATLPLDSAYIGEIVVVENRSNCDWTIACRIGRRRAYDVGNETPTDYYSIGTVGAATSSVLLNPNTVATFRCEMRPLATKTSIASVGWIYEGPYKLQAKVSGSPDYSYGF